MATKGKRRLERSDVEFPLWRKKVDASLFDYKGTTIPNWACRMWDLQTIFQHCRSRSNADAKVIIRFEGVLFSGWVTVAYEGRPTPAYRLWFDEDLSARLKNTFLMSYMRSLENALSQNSSTDIELRIPFWEFLDIEFDTAIKEFRFVAYYKQEPSFPELFKRLIGSPALRKIADEIEQKGSDRIHKQQWKHRNELAFEVGAKNVIYILIDTENKLLYVGEGGDLVKRVNQPHKTIPHWNYFRYSVLPDALAPYRLSLERMVIRDFASLLGNKRGVNFISISEFKLANDKIDL